MSDGEKYGNDMLAQAHFEPGETAYLFTPEFGRAELIAALFEGSRENPKTLPIQLDLPEPMNARVTAEMVVRKVAPVHSYDKIRNEFCSPAADWCVEGELRTATAFGPASTALRIYVLDGEQQETYSDAYIQRIPKNPDPDGIIETDEAFLRR